MKYSNNNGTQRHQQQRESVTAAMAVIFLSIDVTIHDHEEKVKKLVHLKTPAPPVQNLK